MCERQTVFAFQPCKDFLFHRRYQSSSGPYNQRNRRTGADWRMVCPLANVPGAGSPVILIWASESTTIAGEVGAIGTGLLEN